MIKAIQNAVNRLFMTDDEYKLNGRVHEEAKNICREYLKAYYLINSGWLEPKYRARLIEHELKHKSKEDIKKLAFQAITQYGVSANEIRF